MEAMGGLKLWELRDKTEITVNGHVWKKIVHLLVKKTAAESFFRRLGT